MRVGRLMGGDEGWAAEGRGRGEGMRAEGRG